MDIFKKDWRVLAVRVLNAALHSEELRRAREYQASREREKKLDRIHTRYGPSGSNRAYKLLLQVLYFDATLMPKSPLEVVVSVQRHVLAAVQRQNAMRLQLIRVRVHCERVERDNVELVADRNSVVKELQVWKQHAQQSDAKLHRVRAEFPYIKYTKAWSGDK